MRSMNKNEMVTMEMRSRVTTTKTTIIDNRVVKQISKYYPHTHTHTTKHFYLRVRLLCLHIYEIHHHTNIFMNSTVQKKY